VRTPLHLNDPAFAELLVKLYGEVAGSTAGPLAQRARA
jgi:uncharacterized protein (UPF0261 family)